MRTLLVLFVLQISFGLYSFESKAISIKINGKSCNYSIEVPAGLDTIPSDTLINRFGKGFFDVGLYDSKSKGYFDGKYIQYVFMPSRNSLNQFSFAQISKEIQKSIDVAKKQPQTGKFRLITDNFKADQANHLLFITGSIVSGLKARKYVQIMLLTKFGFLKIMQYEALGVQTTNTSYNDLLASVNILDNFKYTEPPSRFNLNIWHLIIAFGLGLLVYFSIQYAPVIKQFLTKK